MKQCIGLMLITALLTSSSSTGAPGRIIKQYAGCNGLPALLVHRPTTDECGVVCGTAAECIDSSGETKYTIPGGWFSDGTTRSMSDALAFSSDGAVLYSSVANLLKQHTLGTAGSARSINLCDDDIRFFTSTWQLAVHPVDHNKVLVVNLRRKMRLWDINRNERLWKYEGAVAFSNDGSQIARAEPLTPTENAYTGVVVHSADNYSVVRIYDFYTLKAGLSNCAYPYTAPDLILYSDDNRYIVCGGYGDVCVIDTVIDKIVWNQKTSFVEPEFDPNAPKIYPQKSVRSLSCCGSYVAATWGDGVVRVYTLESGELAHEIGNDILKAVFTGDAHRLVTLGNDGAVREWLLA